MEIAVGTRNSLLSKLRELIDGNGTGNGRISMCTNEDVEIVSLPFNNPSFVISSGTGVFDITIPYLRGVVPETGTGVKKANRFKLYSNNDTLILTGTLGDPDNIGRDIQFNTLIWNDFDNISITGLRITVPSGSNDYIAQ